MPQVVVYFATISYEKGILEQFWRPQEKRLKGLSQRLGKKRFQHKKRFKGFPGRPGDMLLGPLSETHSLSISLCLSSTHLSSSAFSASRAHISSLAWIMSSTSAIKHHEDGFQESHFNISVPLWGWADRQDDSPYRGSLLQDLKVSLTKR